MLTSNRSPRRPPKSWPAAVMSPFLPPHADPAETEARIGDLYMGHGSGRCPNQTRRRPHARFFPRRRRRKPWILELQGPSSKKPKNTSCARELDPRNPRFLWPRLVAMSRGGSVGVPVGAIVAFDKTVELSPEFAPACLTSPRFTRCARKLCRRRWTPRNMPRLWSQVTPATNTRLPSFSRTWTNGGGPKGR